MTQVGRQPFPNAEEHRRLSAIKERVDAASARPQQYGAIADAMTGVVTKAQHHEPMVQPPGYGAPQRDAIASIVDGVVEQVIDTIRELQTQLKALEDQVLVSSAAAKVTLNTQVEVCAAVREETEHMREIIDGIAKKVLRL
jgi:hypothetical protein